MFVILKETNYRYSGKLLSENETTIIIDDIKLGRIEIAKDSIAVRGGD